MAFTEDVFILILERSVWHNHDVLTNSTIAHMRPFVIGNIILFLRTSIIIRKVKRHVETCSFKSGKQIWKRFIMEILPLTKMAVEMVARQR